MNIINSNYINFSARLNVSHIQTNKQQWAALAKTFEASTPKQKYNLEAALERDEISIEGCSPSGNYRCCVLGKNASEKFMNLPENKAVTVLKKFLKIFTDADKSENKCLDFLISLEKDDKYKTLEYPVKRNGSTRFDAINTALQDKIEADYSEIINKARTKNEIINDTEFVY